jgi:prepilin-type N-terminal cleavage/methylation domain-containing protein
VTRHAFTLIEMLAVIVIVSMIAAMMSVSLAAADDQAAFLSAAAQCRDLDAKVRQCAQTQGLAALLRIGEDHDSLTLHVGANQIATVDLPLHLTVQIERDRPAQLITFDRAGRSPDYHLSLKLNDRFRGWRVCGLTGFFIEESTS